MPHKHSQHGPGYHDFRCNLPGVCVCPGHLHSRTKPLVDRRVGSWLPTGTSCGKFWSVTEPRTPGSSEASRAGNDNVGRDVDLLVELALGIILSTVLRIQGELENILGV